jgi:hypothetical protein
LFPFGRFDQQLAPASVVEPRPCVLRRVQGGKGDAGDEGRQ